MPPFAESDVSHLAARKTIGDGVVATPPAPPYYVTANPIELNVSGTEALGVTMDGARPATEARLPDIIAGRYRLEREIGHGGMATVYLCLDEQTETHIAIKVLRPELGSAVVVERFLREIAFASELDHPQIPKVLDSGVIGDLPFYAMTYIEGESLRARLDRVKQLTIDEAVRITKEIIAPTAYAHRMGIVHRDIKPANILIGADRVYVLDFGVARAVAASTGDSLTSTGIAIGTPAYMSPEQALADANIDARSDIYSLGCVTYEMIAGIAPFVGATAQAVMARRFVAPPPPLSETREFVPASVELAVSRALCKAPADRWQTVSEFGDALTAQVAPPSTAVQQVVLDRKRRRYGTAIAAAVLIAAGTMGFVAWSMAGRDRVAIGRRALERWDLPAAESAFGKAARDAGDAAGQLWMAQLLILKGAPVSDWAPLARKAADHKADLSPRDRLRAEALAAYASESAIDRCGPLRKFASAADPAHPDDFTPVVTFADCLEADRSVVPDSSTRSGYRFASSYQQAVSLYESVIDHNATNGDVYRVIAPRLQRMLWTSRNDLRMGVMRGQSEAQFVAAPALVADTIVFEPFLLGGNDAVKSDDDKLNRFVARNIEELKNLAKAWTRAAPGDPDADESLAEALESAGQIDGASSALTSIRAARVAAANIDEPVPAKFVRRVRLANANVRLLLKSGQFRGARMLADTAIAWTQPAGLGDSLTDPVDDLTEGMLAITGRLGRVIELEQKDAGDYLVRLRSGETKKLPGDLGAEVLRLQTYSAFGAPADSIVALDARIRESLESLVSSAQAEDFRGAVLRYPLSLSVDAIGTKALASLGPSPDLFLNAVKAIDAHNIPLARKLADSLAVFRSGRAPGEITMDVVLQQSWLRAAVHDSAGAATSLDRALRGLTHAPGNLLDGAKMGPALVRAMLMRSRLARASGDGATSSRWLLAAQELWANADSPLKAMLTLGRSP